MDYEDHYRFTNLAQEYEEIEALELQLQQEYDVKKKEWEELEKTLELMRLQRAGLAFKRIRVGKKIDKIRFPDRSFSDSGSSDSSDEEKSEEEDESENGLCALCLAHNSEEENSEEEDSSRNYDSSD